MRDAVIVEAVRTPIGKARRGAYPEVHPVELHAHALRSLIARVPGLDPVEIDDVIGGAVGQVGEQSTNTTRLAALAAGFPESVPGVTVDRQCGSSQQALSFAAQGLIAAAYDIVVASGVESMSRVPIGSSALVDGARADVAGPGVAARYPGGLIPQGVSAELIARKWGLSRLQLDEYAATSHQRAAEAWRQGHFDSQVAPLPGIEVARDETIRPGTTVDRLAELPPAFAAAHWSTRFGEIDWKVTAGNSSPLNDGSAALLLTTSDTARRHGWRPRARIHTATVVGDDPILMLTGIIPATARVLARAGLTLADIDAFEVNEAFSSVVLAWLVETGADPAKVNVDGGAIALGHPLGASGARLATTLLHVLERTGGRYGLQTMCEAGGTANATIIERLDA
ncbi:thiolase family protein [Micromonospora sp. PPF5-17]|uniref:Thiolase family protein n=1 Tax=Micromonospora solifontis TaxID=2487138 RepID=A0ABX9WH15_9ACTN|nr:MULTISPECIES: thiolase family protein [Micromonospora]NES37417.1 thiolase family protein [Micromonospora solifontis]NES58038.1 thiolase family protein [Micromonospora sp. PPF5-6]RNL98426.1 thiolase family protein [Micromonospora solifontis]